MFNFFKKNDNENAQNNSFSRLKQALAKTAGSLVGNIILGSADENIDEFQLDEIETNLIKADVGVDLAVEITEKIKKENVKSSQLKGFLKNEFSSILSVTNETAIKFDKNKLNVYVVVGVNGAGKTTLIGKLAHRFKTQGEKVLLVAGDTFRAAAEEQLDIWSQRAGVDILRQDGAQSAALAYTAIDKARNENYNAVIIDTAGRLQNKFNLIEELKKVKNVISKKIGTDNLETILVLDGTQGQNGLSQAKVFLQAVDVSACAITKLDGTPKGGIILSIARDLKIPTKIISTGEKIDDISDFSANEFIDALFE